MTRQKTKIRNALRIYGEQISTDVKLSKTQLSKIIQAGRFIGALLGKLAGLLVIFGVPLTKNLF